MLAELPHTAFATEKRAFLELSKRWPGIAKNGLSQLSNQLHPDSPPERLPFVPDAFRWEAKVQPAQWLDYLFDSTHSRDHAVLRLFEIENYHRITRSKMRAIHWFAVEAWDMANVYVALHVVDKYGVRDETIWTVNELLDTGDQRPLERKDKTEP